MSIISAKHAAQVLDLAAKYMRVTLSDKDSQDAIGKAISVPDAPTGRKVLRPDAEGFVALYPMAPKELAMEYLMEALPE